MKRRQLAVLAVSAAGPKWLAAQRLQSARLGVLSDGGRTPAFNAMFTRLADLGWVEGRNLGIDFYVLADLPSLNAAMVREMVKLKCNVILASGTPAAMAAKADAPATPMVFIIGGDPVGLGLVASMARPGGNATGYVQGSQEIIQKQLSLLRELAPTARRIAVMFEADNPSMMQGVRMLTAAAGKAKLVVEAVPLRDWKDIDAFALKMRREPVDGLLVMNDRITSANVENIARVAGGLGLPAVYGGRHFVEHLTGGMVSYGIDSPALILRSADYVAGILGGAKPSDLPVQQPTQFELVVNLHRARVLGQSVPQSVLLQATEVIR